MDKLKDFRFVKVNTNKEPIHKLNKSFSYDQVKDDENLSVLMPEPYCLLDIDSDEQFNILYRIVTDLKVKTRVMKSGRGGHFWFKTSKPLTNSTHSSTPITLTVDVRSWGKMSMACVKRNGEWRDWLQWDDVPDELPSWLKPIKYPKELLGMQDGDGRDSALFSYIIPLINNQLSKEEIRTTFNIINEFIFSEPLTQPELDKMFDGNEIFESHGTKFYNGNAFLHHRFADWLKTSYFFKSYGGRVYMYDQGVYSEDLDKIFIKMLDKLPELKERQMKETYGNLRLKTLADEDEINPMLVSVKNGILDLNTMSLINHSPQYFITSKWNCRYDGQAYDENVDKAIDDWSNKDPEIRAVIEEMLGYALLGDCRFQVAFILLGSGGNGKSAFLDMVKKWVGEENCSALALEDLGERFRTAELVGKVVNIGDDGDGDVLQHTGIIKRIVTGDVMTMEHKGQQVFRYANVAKLFLSANELPPTFDKSDGFHRRFIIVPFTAVFDSDNPTRNLTITEQLSTDNARSYLLNLAIIGLQRLLKNRTFSRCEAVMREKLKYEVANNNVLAWMKQLTDESLIKDVSVESYRNYNQFCDEYKFKPMNFIKFKSNVDKYIEKKRTGHL